MAQGRERLCEAYASKTTKQGRHVTWMSFGFETVTVTVTVTEAIDGPKWPFLLNEYGR
jgi:hypothetical protein